MEQPLKIYFLPFPAAGHMIPLCDIARLFSSRGHHVTIITAPVNAQTLHHYISNHFHIHTIPFPSQHEASSMLLRAPLEHLLEQYPPHCIVADILYPWVHDLANKFHIPRLSFNGSPLFAVSAIYSFFSNPPPIDVSSDSSSYVIQGFPHHITMKATPSKELVGYMQPMWETMLKANGIIVNNFTELDGQEYVEHYQKTTGQKAWNVGPASLIHTTVEEQAERGEKSVVSVHDCLVWLNSKPLNSVLYICFGSLCHFPDKQLYEIACGIEALGHHFIWVVPEKKGKEDESDADKEKWLPKGFEERNKMKGMIIKGWAPQVMILGHTAVGAFLTHCGWNSTVEAVSAGVPLITWPVHSEQFYNEKLITQVRGIGVEVGAEEWNNVGSWNGDKLVGRDRIEKAVRRLMDNGNEAQEIRRRAQMFGQKAKQAVQQGGSSYNNLTTLINDIKRLRDNKSLIQ